MGLGKRLRQLREERGLSLTDVERALEGLISFSLLGQYERGQKSPPYPKLEKLADLYGVTTDYLLGRTDNRKTMIFHQTQVCESPAQYLISDDDRRVQEIIQELYRLTDDPEILENILQYAKFLVHQERLNPAKKSSDKQKDTK